MKLAPRQRRPNPVQMTLQRLSAPTRSLRQYTAPTIRPWRRVSIPLAQIQGSNDVSIADSTNAQAVISGNNDSTTVVGDNSSVLDTGNFDQVLVTGPNQAR